MANLRIQRLIAPLILKMLAFGSVNYTRSCTNTSRASDEPIKGDVAGEETLSVNSEPELLPIRTIGTPS
jgi:hypothetical protein